MFRIWKLAFSQRGIARRMGDRGALLIKLRYRPVVETRWGKTGRGETNHDTCFVRIRFFFIQQIFESTRLFTD